MPKEKTIGIVTERKTPTKLKPVGVYYLLGEVRVENPRFKSLMLDGKSVSDDSLRYRVLDKGPNCDDLINVGDCVVLTHAAAGITRFITGTAYKFVMIQEILGILSEKESLIWDDTIEREIADIERAKTRLVELPN